MVKNTPVKSKLPLIIGGVVLLILIGVGIFFLGKNSSSQQTTQQVTISQVPLATQTIASEETLSPAAKNNETSNWKTYSRNRLTFKYPDDWSIQGQSVQSADFKKEGTQQLNIISGASIDESQTDVPQVNRTAENFVEWGDMYIKDPSTVKKSNINGNSVVQFKSDHYNGGNFGWESLTTVFFRRDGTRIDIRLSNKKGEQSKFEDTYNNLLKSVKL